MLGGQFAQGVARSDPHDGVGVRGQDQAPADGQDRRLGQPAAVGLLAPDVEVVDLPPAQWVTQRRLGDAPQRVSPFHDVGRS